MLLFVGRINYLKNVDFIVRSLKILKDKGFPFKMLFVGSGEDEDQLHTLTEQLGLTKNVIFAGRISEKESLEKIYARADLFLFPSMYDTNSLVQIEAACQGTPTLFLRGAKTAGTITENVNGFLCAPYEEAYADKIADVLTDKALYEKVSANAKRDLSKTWDEVTDMINADYVLLTSKSKK